MKFIDEIIKTTMDKREEIICSEEFSENIENAMKKIRERASLGHNNTSFNIKGNSVMKALVGGHFKNLGLEVNNGMMDSISFKW